MIERLQRIASLLSRLRLPILLLTLLFAGLFVVDLYRQDSADSALMLPALVGFFWSALLYSYAHLFAQLPDRPRPEHGFWQRLNLRFRRLLMTIMALLMFVLTLAVVVLSYQLLRTHFAA